MKYLLVGAAAFLLGQYSIRYSYSPEALEENALLFSTKAFFIGCIIGQTSEEVCISETDRFYSQVRDIWSNQAWRK